ncbi:MAG: DUF2789 family protein [Pseudomonadales bacterium]
MRDLFAQLGLPSSIDKIQQFIESNRPIPAHLPLHEDPFWSPSQAEFLRSNVRSDTDWAIVTDALNAALRK